MAVLVLVFVGTVAVCVLVFAGTVAVWVKVLVLPGSGVSVIVAVCVKVSV